MLHFMIANLEHTRAQFKFQLTLFSVQFGFILFWVSVFRLSTFVLGLLPYPITINYYINCAL